MCLDNKLRTVAGIAGAVALLWVTATFTAEAQQDVRLRRVGLLVVGVAEAYQDYVDALRDGLRDLGYAEGKNLVIEYRWAEGRYVQLPQLAGQLLQFKPEVIVTSGVPGIRAVQGASKT